MKRERTYKWIIIGICIILLFSLTGCVTAKNRSRMFDILKADGYINVGERTAEQYDEELSINQSPIPANLHYYIYNTDDFSYKIDYKSTMDGGENIDTFIARVETSKNGEVIDKTSYIFENRKIFWIFWKIYLVDIKPLE